MDKSPETTVVEEKPVASTNTEVTQVKPEEKKGGKKWLWFCCCGCIGLLVLCFGIGLGVYLLAPQALNQVLKSTNVLPTNTSLTKIPASKSDADIRVESDKVQTKLDSAEAELNSRPAGSTVVVNLTPEELIYSIAANSSDSDNLSDFLQYISIGMKPNILTAQVDIGNLIAKLQTENPNATQGSPIDLSVLSGTNAQVELTTNSDNTGVLVKSISTGNPIVDSFINVQSTLDSANGEINNTLGDSFHGIQIKNVYIEQDNLKLILTK